MKKTKKREVGEQSKGFRLQKLRAAELLLDAVETSSQAAIYCAVEHGTDVNLVKADVKQSSRYHEENKEYNSETAFSLNSSEILNTLVIFVECWISKEFSKNTRFGIYATNGIAKEKITKRITNSKASLPQKPVLEILQSKELLDSNLLQLLSSCIVQEYRKQYAKNLTQSHIQVIENFSPTDWQEFFSKLDWKLGESDSKKLKQEILIKIKSSRFFNADQLRNKEELILSSLINLIDERQAIQDCTERAVYGSDVRLVFVSVAAGENKKMDDPAWKLWEKLEPSDKRNFQSKMKAVCKNLSDTDMHSWNRKVGLSLVEQEEFSSDRSILALRFRVFDVCQTRLAELLKQNAEKVVKNEVSEEEISTWISDIVEVAKKAVADVSVNFSYTVKENESFIRGIILWLLDSCYLNFDGKDNVG